mmetsp:Transcript_73324/g.218866  ORF Transcript_73324/g.218866 Transcript_73324/m.218866 type:complete len:289 (+) Transcript_73324:379-1245(+)
MRSWSSLSGSSLPVASPLSSRPVDLRPEERLISDRHSSGLEAVVTSVLSPLLAAAPASCSSLLWRLSCSFSLGDNAVFGGGGNEEEDDVLVAHPSLTLEASSSGSSSPHACIWKLTGPWQAAVPLAGVRFPSSGAGGAGLDRRRGAHLTVEARLAYSSVLLESSKCVRPGCTFAIIATSPSPVREALSIRVSLESRYGGFFLGVEAPSFPRAVSASMQLASAKSDWLMRAPSFRAEPQFCVKAARSEPARSMRLIFECSVRTSAKPLRNGPWPCDWVLTCSIVNVNTA